MMSSDRASVSAQTLAEQGSPPVLTIVRDRYRYHGLGRHFKRAIDVIAVLVALPILAPLLILISLGVIVASPGYPLFRQIRVGQGGQQFGLLKFRTMHRDAEARLHADPELYERYRQNDFKLPLAEDPRAFRFGRFLRRTSLDELPQLFNVLAGSMSLVGPRPVVPSELPRYGQWIDAYLAAVPGLTGPWQANGRNRVRYPERAMLDAAYIEQWSLRTDLAIIAKTIPSVFRGHGCH